MDGFQELYDVAKEFRATSKTQLGKCAGSTGKRMGLLMRFWACGTQQRVKLRNLGPLADHCDEQSNCRCNFWVRFPSPPWLWNMSSSKLATTFDLFVYVLELRPIESKKRKAIDHRVLSYMEPTSRPLRLGDQNQRFDNL